MTASEWVSHLGRPLLRILMAPVCAAAPFVPGIEDATLVIIYTFASGLYGIRAVEKYKMAQTTPEKGGQK